MYPYVKLMRLELFVLAKDSRVRIKLMLSFLLIIYVLSYSLFESDANILPFFYFGFFFVSPLIDYSFFSERLHKRFPLLLGRGFSLIQIIVSKSLTIFALGLFAGIFFTSLAFYFNSAQILHASFDPSHFKYFLTIALYNFWIIILSGLLQTRFEIIFPVRLLHIAGFLIFVNFQNHAIDSLMRHLYPIQIISLAVLISATVLMVSVVNKDKIA
ncbi:MAG: hypothetical protein R6V47_06955 [Candidatus Delongbacteria bacterium]